MRMMGRAMRTRVGMRTRKVDQDQDWANNIRILATNSIAGEIASAPCLDLALGFGRMPFYE